MIIITAHGTIESAVEAMKLGAIDFLQKPFTPDEIRDLVTKIMERKSLDESNPADYNIFIELAKKSINERHFDAAASHLKKAISLNPSNPDGFNFLVCSMKYRAISWRLRKNTVRRWRWTQHLHRQGKILIGSPSIVIIGLFGNNLL